MKIEKITITVKQLTENYVDDGEGGVYGLNNQLTLRPSFQREFCFNDKQRNEVIKTIYKGFPLGIMYWSKTEMVFAEADGFCQKYSTGFVWSTGIWSMAVGKLLVSAGTSGQF